MSPQDVGAGPGGHGVPTNPAPAPTTIPTVVNPEAIGDPTQTPVVYLGEAGKVLGIRQRTDERDRVVRSRTMYEVARELDALADDRDDNGDHVFSDAGRAAVHVAAAFVEKWARNPEPLPSTDRPDQPEG